jgi:TetR/AcrR family transcriptional regulator, transcriptional repressor for nem operon
MEKASLKTAEYILEIAAPIFNRKGYVGTSLSDITEATGLTKGAIYCNFANKEMLAIEAFRKNVEQVLSPLTVAIKAEDNAISKLHAITQYYRNYYPLAAEQGGCPILNVGVDARSVNPLLYAATRELVNGLIANLAGIIQKGIAYGQLRPETNAEVMAKNFYSIVEGGICLSFLHEDDTYLHHVLDLADELVEKMKMISQQTAG